MFLLVAKGNKVYARQAERSRPGHARYAHPKNVGAGAYAWIRDFRANRTDEQGRFPPECGLVISRHSTTREGRDHRWRMETHRKQQAGKVLHSDGEGTKEARQRNTRMGPASGRNRQNFGDLLGSGPCLCSDILQQGFDHCSEKNRSTGSWTRSWLSTWKWQQRKR